MSGNPPEDKRSLVLLNPSYPANYDACAIRYLKCWRSYVISSSNKYSQYSRMYVTQFLRRGGINLNIPLTFLITYYRSSTVFKPAPTAAYIPSIIEGIHFPTIKPNHPWQWSWKFMLGMSHGLNFHSHISTSTYICYGVAPWQPRSRPILLVTIRGVAIIKRKRKKGMEIPVLGV